MKEKQNYIKRRRMKELKNNKRERERERRRMLKRGALQNNKMKKASQLFWGKCLKHACTFNKPGECYHLFRSVKSVYKLNTERISVRHKMKEQKEAFQ